MSIGKIECPECKHQFELADTIREELEAGFKKQIREKEKELKDKIHSLEADRERMEEEFKDKVREQLKEARNKAEQKAKKEMEDKLAEMAADQREQEKELKTLKQNEIELRKEKQRLEKAKEEMDLELQRKLDEERKRIQQEAETKFVEQHRLKDLEKDKMINDLKASLDDMKRKAEQGSMETQGEVLELDFERQLKDFFNTDFIEPVPKGVKGADLVQTVRNQFQKDAGIILWEMKNTKAWNSQWASKLKDDAIEVRASISILVSTVLPEGINRFGQYDGIWVCDPASALPLASALREQLLAVAKEQEAAVGKNDKMDMMYKYLSGNEFKQKIEGIVEAFTVMNDQITRERRAMEKQWKEREKAVERVIKNTVGLYGDMQGIIGGAIPTIQALELDDSPHLLEQDDGE